MNECQEESKAKLKSYLWRVIDYLSYSHSLTHSYEIINFAKTAKIYNHFSKKKNTAAVVDVPKIIIVNDDDENSTLECRQKWFIKFVEVKSSASKIMMTTNHHTSYFLCAFLIRDFRVSQWLMNVVMNVHINYEQDEDIILFVKYDLKIIVLSKKQIGFF